MLHDRRPSLLRRLTTAVAVTTTLCGTALVGAMALAPSPSVSAPATVINLGGRVTDPGFRGVVTSRSQQLGVARLGDGAFGVCFDTGAEHPWPSGTPAATLRRDPQVGYLLATYLRRAKTDARYAAALWWVTGLDLGVNRYPSAMRASIAQMRADSSSTYGSVKAIHDRLLGEARSKAPGPHGYDTGRLTLASAAPTVVSGRIAAAGSVSGVGVRSATGTWLRGYRVTVTLSGATFADGTARVWRGRTGATPRTLAYRQSAPVAVTATMRVEGLPGHRYRLHDAHDRSQRVGVSAGLVSATRTVRAGSPVGFARARKVDATSGAALAGAVFTAWVDANRNRIAETAESARTLTAVASGYTPAVRTFRDASVCFRETRPPVGYVANPTLACIRAGGTSASAAVAVVKDRRMIWHPELSTRVNHQVAAVGALLEDSVTVTRTGGHRLTGEWRLVGPVAPADGSCAGLAWTRAPVAASGTFTVTGDGTYDVGRHVVPTAGCHTYVERVLGSTATTTTRWTTPGIPAETTLVKGRPVLTTQVNRQVATAGAVLVDRVTVVGTQGATVTGGWRLLGPIAARNGSCERLTWTGAPVAAAGTFTARGDGAYDVGRHPSAAAGCYTYSESLRASASTLPTAWTMPGTPTETSAVHPGPVRVPAHPTVTAGGHGPLAAADRRGGTPARVRIAAVGLDARLTPTRFRGSDLAPPPDIRLGGLWADGASLDAVAGTSVVVGHVSDNHDRPGAFRRLWRVGRGTIITTRAHGTARQWRVTTVRRVARGELSRGLFAQSLHRRLVLVTCADRVSHGGYFHYTSNEVVVAVPVRET